MEQTQRAKRAEQIYHDDVFIEAFEAINDELIREWKTCHPGEVERLLEIKRMQTCLEKFVVHFENAMKAGK